MDNEELEKECARMRVASGAIQSESKIVLLLYLLARDHFPVGELESVVDAVAESGNPAVFTNGWLAQWAMDAEFRIFGKKEQRG